MHLYKLVFSQGICDSFVGKIVAFWPFLLPVYANNAPLGHVYGLYIRCKVSISQMRNRHTQAYIRILRYLNGHSERAAYVIIAENPCRALLGVNVHPTCGHPASFFPHFAFAMFLAICLWSLATVHLLFLTLLLLLVWFQRLEQWIVCM